eukprot:scaffold97450_cov68-Phaeocystis_antarctica.AAC.4
MPQPAPRSGQPRPISRLGRAGRPYCTGLVFHIGLNVSGASLSRKKAVARRSFFCWPTLAPGQQQENSKLLPGGQVLPTSCVRQTVVAAYL